MGTESIEKKSFNSNNDTDVIVIPVTIDEHNLIDGTREIIKVIRPSWKSDNIEFKLFTDGITNKLIGCFYKQPTTTKVESQTTTNNDLMSKNNADDDVVLVRVYGNKTDLLIDRKAETKNIKLLHHYGFAPSLYGVFNNGLAYEYVPGVTLTINTILIPQIWKLIARRMAEMHRINCDLEYSKEPALKIKTNKFMDLVPDKFTDDKIHQRIEKIFPSINKLREEFYSLYEKLKKLNSPIVFAHNDLLLGNVIYTEKLNRVTFIDYEYASYNFQGFDIGNHFTEFAGIDEIDYALYPNKEFQLLWLREYLETYNKTSQVETKDVEKLYVQVNQFALASHFLWSIWALIQAEHSTINFDFVRFGETRYNEYLAKKDEFLALEYKEEL